MNSSKVCDENLPKVKRKGVLNIGNEIPCYILSNEERVFKFSKLVYALRGIENSKIGNYLDAKNIKKYLPDRLKPITDNNKDRVPHTIIYFIDNYRIEKGYRCQDFIDICQAFVDAFDNGDKLSDVQKRIAYNAYKFVATASKVGVQALVDSATEYKVYNDMNFIKAEINKMKKDNLKEWYEFFPDELWYQLCKLSSFDNRYKFDKSNLINLSYEIIYGGLDEEYINYCMKNKPIKLNTKNKLNIISRECIERELMNRIFEVIGIAKTCNTIYELKEKINS